MRLFEKMTRILVDVNERDGRFQDQLLEQRNYLRSDRVDRVEEGSWVRLKLGIGAIGRLL
jgi:hypothetical protein